MGDNGDNLDVSGNEQGESPVGPGNPPKEHQFAPGQSGNPAGRPRTKPITDAINKICSGDVTLKIDGKEQTISGVDALARIALNQAMKGKPPWWERVMERVEGKVADELQIGGTLPGLTPDLLKKISDAKEGPE